jgi:hypothetical protein
VAVLVDLVDAHKPAMLELAEETEVKVEVAVAVLAQVKEWAELV